MVARSPGGENDARRSEGTCMNLRTGFTLLCLAILIIHSTTGEAARKQGRRGTHHGSPTSTAHQKDQPYGAGMNEEQSRHALESEILRKMGSSIQEGDYPEEARREGWSGTTRVDVVVGSDGKIKEVSVQESSGFPILDDQAMRMVDRATLWWIPQRLRNREVTVTVPVGFYIREPSPISADAVAGIAADRVYLPASNCRTASETDSGAIASLALDLVPPLRPVQEPTLADWTTAMLNSERFLGKP
jgi:TonB family protein